MASGERCRKQGIRVCTCSAPPLARVGRCKCGNLKEAWQRLEKAIDMPGAQDVRAQALDDPDLEPLWKEIGEI